MDHSSIIAANAAAWDEASGIHKAKTLDKLKAAFADPAFTALDRATAHLLRHIDIKDKSVLHLGCNNGREIISLKRAGAGTCTGVDISDGFINQAAELAGAAQASGCHFICTDALAYKPDNGGYDIVLISVGFIQWLPDLDAALRQVYDCLKPGGVFVFTDYHPFGTMFNKQDPAQPHLAVYNYFDTKAEVSTSGLDYVDGVKKPYASKPLYYFKRGFADYLSAAANAGLDLKIAEEYPWDVAGIARSLEERNIGIPLSFGLIFEKSP